MTNMTVNAMTIYLSRRVLRVYTYFTRGLCVSPVLGRSPRPVRVRPRPPWVRRYPGRSRAM